MKILRIKLVDRKQDDIHTYEVTEKNEPLLGLEAAGRPTSESQN
jgi:hypothetical protein